MPKPAPELISREDAFRQMRKTFYTGVPCRRGHLSPRYVSTGNCIACLHRHHVAGARNPYDPNLVPCDFTGVWRPAHWDFATVERFKVDLQKFINTWHDAPPAPAQPQMRFRKVYGERMVSAGTVTDLEGNKHELWTTRTGAPRHQVSVRTSGAPSAESIDLLTEDALRVPVWVVLDLGHGPRWYAVENIDYAVFDVIRDEARAAAALNFGLMGDA